MEVIQIVPYHDFLPLFNLFTSEELTFNPELSVILVKVKKNATEKYIKF